jgi:hypothetical protein
MSYRVPVTVDRGTMDKTLVWIYPWEKQLLEEVQRGEVTEHTLDEISSLAGASSVVPIKLPSGGQRETLKGGEFLPVETAPSLREQFEAMAKVDPSRDPINDPEGEWIRLLNVYGMHPTVPMSVAEKVYGNESRFKDALAQFAHSLGSVAEPNLTDAEPADMSRQEIMRALKAQGIKFAITEKRDELEQKLVEAMV